MKRPTRPFARFLIPVLLLCALPLAAGAQQGPREGSEYALIQGGAPWQAGKAPAAKGRTIEVAEVFAYWCVHCAHFQPKLEAWKRKLPRDVRVTYVPLPSGRDDAFARGFFAAQAAGALDRVHAPLFVAVHEAGAMPSNPSIDELAAWYGQQGLDRTRIKAAMEAPALADRLAAARAFAIRSGVEGTPSLVVDGRYRILGDSYEQLLRNADAVVAHVRAGH